MASLRLAISAAMVAAAVLITGAAQAGDAGRAWGTIKDPGTEFAASAAAHAQSAQTAIVDAQGRPTATSSSTNGGFPAVTSCGTCTTITIQGNNNSVTGNSITSTNDGIVTSNGNFFR